MGGKQFVVALFPDQAFVGKTGLIDGLTFRPAKAGDIITIYGRKPRLKSPSQLIAELDMLRELGWRNEVFIVDDNFIGNAKHALELAVELKVWGDRHG